MKTSIVCLLLFTAAARAAVSPVGVDSTTAANWRTGAALEADGRYGTSGYVVFGLNANNNVYTQPFDISSANAANAYSLPAGIEAVTTIDTNIGMWSGNGNFGQIQDPATNALTAAPVLANSSGTRQFTISRATSAAWRLTCMTASGDNEGTLYNVTVDDGSGPRTQTWDHTVNGLAYHVFDITAGTSPITVTVTTTGQNRSLTGLAFDPVPVVLPPPVIVADPSSATVVQGGPVSFTVSATGSGMTLQWQRNGSPIPGATGTTLRFLTTAADNGAAYRCVATNASGSAASNPATLTLAAEAPRTADYRAAVDAEPSRIAFFPFDGDTGPEVTNTENPLAGGTVNLGWLTGNPALVAGKAALAGSATLIADEAWEFQDDASGTVEAFIYQTVATPAYNPCLFSIRQTPTNVRMSLHVDAAGTKFYFWNGAAVAAWDAPVNTIGRRTHVAFVFDAGNVTLYADGVSLGTQAVSLGGGAGLPAQVGASDGGTVELFPGSVDELAIYSAALPAASIEAHVRAWYGPLPEITANPLSQTVVEGAPVSFTVTSLGSDLTYQWRRNGESIPSGTGASLQVVTVAADNGAVYDCIVSNTAGSRTSNPATLTLVAPAPQSAAYRAAIGAEPGRLAYFPFDGDIGPSVTNRLSLANGGTLRGTAVLTGAAAEVVGTTGLRGSAGLTADPEWEFPDGTGSVEAMLYQSAASATNPCFFSIRDSASVRYSLHGATDGSSLYFWNGSSVAQWTTPKNMIGRRSHVVITFDGGNVTAYFDGLSLGTRVNGLGFGSGISTQIGSATENSDELWPGTIDELVLYADPLAPAAVNAHASAWFGAVAQPMITQMNVSGGVLSLTVPSAVGLSYLIESSPDLISPWTASGPATPGTGSDLMLTVPAAGSAEFFRVRVFR